MLWMQSLNDEDNDLLHEIDISVRFVISVARF